MKIILQLALIFSLILSIQTANGIDIAKLTTTQTFNCLKNNGNTFAIIRGLRSTGALDTNAVANLKNARAAGLHTDIYMFPCRGKNATAQVQSMVSGISSNLYGTVWIDVQDNPSPGCSWSGYNATSNCNFLLSLIKGLRQKGKSVGVYSSAYMWQRVFQSTSACTAAAANAPLWYAHYNKIQSFIGFKAFAGWTSPKMKQFAGDVSLCSADIDKNWRP